MGALTRLAIFSGLILSTAAHAQNYRDVLRYSEKFYQGTARTAGAGNAFGALGADFGAATINPAGIGVFRTPEIMTTFALNYDKATADYLGTTTSNDKYGFNMSNLGLVIANVRTNSDGTTKTSGWVAVNTALGFNRTNNFNRNIVLQGKNRRNSITEMYANDANGYAPANLPYGGYGDLGYGSYLIDPDATHPNFYQSIIHSRFKGTSNIDLTQQDQYNTRGAMNDINLTVAGNYENKLYLGGSAILSTVGFKSTRTFYERNNDPKTINIYSGHLLSEYVNTSGVGLGMALGGIYRATDVVRLGLSVQTPTFYFLSDAYNSTIPESQTDAGFNPYDSIPEGNFNYRVVTPLRATGSISFILGKHGFISADVEMVNYGAGRFNNTFSGSLERNQAIQEILTRAYNIRLGGEYRVIENFAVRAGYAYYGAPLNAKVVDNKYSSFTNMFSFGGGYREDGGFFMDIAAQLSTINTFRQPYTIDNVEVDGAGIRSARTNFMLTLGTKF